MGGSHVALFHDALNYHLAQTLWQFLHCQTNPAAMDEVPAAGVAAAATTAPAVTTCSALLKCTCATCFASTLDLRAPSAACLHTASNSAPGATLHNGHGNRNRNNHTPLTVGATHPCSCWLLEPACASLRRLPTACALCGSPALASVPPHLEEQPRGTARSDRA